MSVDPSRIQPPADQLLDHNGVVAEVERLGTLPGVRIEELGRSREGRVIPAVVVGRPDVIEDPRPVQDAARALSLGESMSGEGGAGWPSDLPVPVLFLASNYGNEAAQTEALLEIAAVFAERGAAGDPAMGRVVSVIVPLLNPDGRERALQTWRRYPLATGLTAYGNHYDVQVAREYLHLVEPESVALAELVGRWHPVLLWEVHEDSITLGRTIPETCLCPPMAPADELGSWVASRPGDTHPSAWEQEAKYGSAIARAWRDKGYRLLHDPAGRHGWPGTVTAGFEHLAQHPETRFTRAMSLRGVTTFITESARRPGTQTWEERIGQKVTAGLAIVRTAAEDVGELSRIVHETALAGLGADPNAAFVLPAGQSRDVVDHAVRVLTTHDVTTLVREDGTIVVPKAQARRATAQVLLSLAEGRHQSFTATHGLRVLDSERPELVARVPATPGTRAGLPVGVVSPPGIVSRIAVYAGQGVKDFAAEGHLGGVRRLLDRADVPFTLIEADDIAAGVLVDTDVLVVPKGDADAIVVGSRPGPLWYGTPWHGEEQPRGLGAEGCAAIREFVTRGGHYVGIDGGGAVLASSRHLGLIDCDIAAENIGTGLVELALHAPDDPVFEGLTGSWDEKGEWREGVTYAMTNCEAWLGEFGAVVLRAGAGTHVLASLSRVLPVPGVAHLHDPLAGQPAYARAVVVRGRCGAGEVTLFAVDPTYRSLSERSARLLLNAVCDPRP